ncbi:MAG TPA: class I SAM-dependent methyltransferase [Bryobacteraceae bacterium]|nr:class I SAM-dependent methyltransferase [Bryobacteraceae bacterium]
MTVEAITEVLGEHFGIAAADGALALGKLGLGAGTRVLDAGTGSGNFAIYLASQGLDVVTGEPATDESQYARRDWAAQAERAGMRERIRFEAFDASRMPFGDGAFAAVFFFGVLHHIDEGARWAVIREAFRVTAPRGAVVFLEPREAMLERVRAKDAAHPPAADPTLYLGDATVRVDRMEGAMMDVTLLRRA